MIKAIYKDECGLTPAAKMMGMLAGYQVYNRGVKIDKWEFNALVANGKVWRSDEPVTDLVEATELLVCDQLSEFKVRTK